MKLTLNPKFSLYEMGGKAFCDSLQVAEDYGKEHKDILVAIEGKKRKDRPDEVGLIDGIIQSEGNPADYFIKVKYKDSQNKTQPKYLMSRDGFMLLVMGFTGQKALRHKLAYINRFNQMESYIMHLQTARMELPALTDAIKAAHDDPQPYHYASEHNLIYRIVLGMDAKTFRKQHGIADGQTIRPHLTAEQIEAIETLQRVDVGLHEAGLPYDERKRILTARRNRVQAIAS